MYLKRLPEFEYFAPKSMKEACSLLQKHKDKAKVLAGGTDLLVNMKHRRTVPQYLIGLKSVPELNGITWSEAEGLRLGALATLQSIADTPIIKEKFGVLAAACSRIGAPHIRSMGTIGGNLCQDTKCLYYTRIHLGREAPCYQAGGDVCYAVTGAKRCSAMAIADTAPALICLEATASISGAKGERSSPVEDFFVSSGKVNLQEDEILTAIKIPNPPPHTAGAYLRYSLTAALNFAMAGVAVVLTVNDGVCEDIRVGLLGVARTPIRARKAEEILKGKKIDNLVDQAAQAASTEAHPLGDIFGSARYKAGMVKVLMKQAISQALERAKSA